MIRNETEYQEAVTRLKQEKARLAGYKKNLATEGLSAAELKRALDPLHSFHLQLEEEVHGYERLKRGDFDEFVNFKGLGQVLIGLRIARGLTQRELAERLGVHETQVSRDERNEYHGIKVDRAGKILVSLGVELVTSIGSMIAQVEPSEVGSTPAPRKARQAKRRKLRSVYRTRSAN